MLPATIHIPLSPHGLTVIGKNLREHGHSPRTPFRSLGGKVHNSKALHFPGHHLPQIELFRRGIGRLPLVVSFGLSDSAPPGHYQTFVIGGGHCTILSRRPRYIAEFYAVSVEAGVARGRPHLLGLDSVGAGGAALALPR